MSGGPGTYDYVVVGGGSSGSVLAARLSEDPQVSVLLLEAGVQAKAVAAMPASFALLIDDPAVNWRYASTPEPGTGGRTIPVPRGKMLGGSSAINGMLYVRGQPEDYDGWRQLGNDGWGWSDVEPLFRRLECYPDGEPGIRGTDGPMRISRTRERNPLFELFFRAAREAGHAVNADYNGARQEGIALTQATLDRGTRMSADRCYLAPARARPNLRVVTGAQATRVDLDGDTCTGVTFVQAGTERNATARREVILCAGAIGSPQLLELSGIGDPQVLRNAGIATRHALHGVGENLRDHLMVRAKWRLLDARLSYNNRVGGLRGAWEALKYVTARSGYLAQSAAPLVAFLRTDPGLARPDIQLTIAPLLVRDLKRRKLETFPGMTVGCYQLRPNSRGSVHVRSASHADAPDIRFNFLADPEDRRTLVDGLAAARRLVGGQALQSVRGDELAPGTAVQSPQAILDYIRATSETAFHPIGTCRMGVDAGAVVDPALRVHGIRRLRVADASVMPTMPSGNTNAACLMIGEKAADLLRRDGVAVRS